MYHLWYIVSCGTRERCRSVFTARTQVVCRVLESAAAGLDKVTGIAMVSDSDPHECAALAGRSGGHWWKALLMVFGKYVRHFQASG